ncbi:MAG: hypothetical protein HZB30_03605 [Nitrospirae bacterium]|nr:hypothetical protein [Nitrospirota bacterium]
MTKKCFKSIGCLVLLFLLGVFAIPSVSYGDDDGESSYTYALHSRGLVNVIDEATGAVIKSIDTDVDGNGIPGDVNTGGTLAALTPNGKKLYVSNAGANMNTVTVISTRKLAKTKDIIIGTGDIRPKHAIVSPNGKWVGVNQWRRNPDGTLRVSFIDASTDTVYQNIDLTLTNPNSNGNQSMHNAWSWNSKYFFTSSYDDDKVYVIKTPNKKGELFTLVKTFDLSIPGYNNNPHYMAPSNDGKEMWIVTEGPSGTLYNSANPVVAPHIYVVDLENITMSVPMLNGVLVNNEVIEGHHGNFSLDGKYFYFCNRGPGNNLTGITVDVYDAATLQLAAHVVTSAGGDGHAYLSPNGKTVAITKYGTNMLTLLDQSNNWAQTDLAVGTGIHIGHITFTADGETGFVSNRVDGAVYEIDLSGVSPLVSKKITIVMPDLTTPAGGGTGQVVNTYTNIFEIPGKLFE